jgi:hypothetical protein
MFMTLTYIWQITESNIVEDYDMCTKDGGKIVIEYKYSTILGHTAWWAYIDGHEVGFYVETAGDVGADPLRKLMERVYRQLECFPPSDNK